ncbi:MAG TPA: ferritin [Thermoanaerobaculaceae bacterium]|nr:ferritin [Thermoanaerobaculaceae bacterium]HRS15284.1 ferritin [Thermoanaerobaculaceae bacterium]
MLSTTMEAALNEQIREEMYSSYLYLAMAAYFEGLDLRGMARWMRVQAQEENSHAMKLFDYVFERGGTVTLKALAEPQATWASPAAAFAAALGHERHITGCIHKLVEQAAAEHDHGTVNFLQWFVKEQVEEEANVEPIARRLEKIGDNMVGLLFTDRELGSRGA